MKFNWFKERETRVFGCYTNGAGARFLPNHLFQNYHNVKYLKEQVNFYKFFYFF